MRPSSCLPLVALALLVCLMLSGSLFGRLVQPASGTQVCTELDMLAEGDEINVAVQIWAIDLPAGLYSGNLSDLKPWTVKGSNPRELVGTTQLAWDMYIKAMRQRSAASPTGVNLPLADGKTNVKVNFYFINIADNLPEAAYYANLPGTAIPVFLTAFFQAAGPIVATQYGLTSTDLYAKMVSTNATVLRKEFGITNGLPFTFIIQPMMAVDAVNTILLNNFGIEDTRSHVVMNSLNSAAASTICDGLSVGSLTPDCMTWNLDFRTFTPGPLRQRRGGERRYNTMFGSLFDSTPNQQAALDNFHTVGVTKIAIIQGAFDSTTLFTKLAADYAFDAAGQLKIAVPITARLVDDQCNATNPATYPAHCAPLATNLKAGQNQAFNHTTPLEMARQIQAAGVEAIILLTNPTTNGAWAIGEMFRQMKAIGYTPKAVSCGGATPTEYAVYTDDPSDIDGWWQTTPWVRGLSGPQYKNVITDTNFELFPADATTYGPEKFAQAYDAAYGPNRPGGNGVAHGLYEADWERDNVFAAVGYNSMIQMQKLIEKAGTRSVEGILAAAVKVSTPGVYHQVQFDQYGRTSRVNEVLFQRDADKLVLLAPYNIGSPPVYPLPTFEERVFDPKFYSTTNEKVMIAINSICIFGCLVLLAVVVYNWRTPVIRAATPSFCVAIIVGGIFMLISNYFNTLVVNSSHCAASAWFLTLGFTLVFASLFIKTFRIFRIFGRKNLSVLKMKDSELLLAVGAFLLIDIIINAAWQGATGFKSEVIVTDVHRPAFNYTQCDYSNGGMGAVWAHIAVKGLMLVLGTLLTWVVRNVPSQFNESASMAAAIYNVVFILCFIIPIIATDVGGRSTVFMIRNFAVMFVVLATLGLLFVPKFVSTSAKDRIAVLRVSGENATIGGNKTQMNTISPTPEDESPSHGTTAVGGIASPKSGQKSVNQITIGSKGAKSTRMAQSTQEDQHTPGHVPSRSPAESDDATLPSYPATYPANSLENKYVVQQPQLVSIDQ